ncbi:PIN domain-containing protein [Salimicrobium halophilum]|uniref:PIN domain-containing protein n=1 Tax=Salimicrobium halophilum TaxID=86666 RepID=A0A1G8SCP9_9BACI|nr:PIN domain-containing protein [Salimicrobium halophilum]SDJ27036.1 PIN domain-containing protein [Salimicrobium halophilum]
MATLISLFIYNNQDYPWAAYLLILAVDIALLLLFHFYNKKAKNLDRSSAIAYLSSLFFTGSGLAYAGSYILAWFYFILIQIAMPIGIYRFSDAGDNFIAGMGVAFIVLVFIQANQSSKKAKGHAKLAKEKNFKKHNKETRDNYFDNAVLYISNGFHLAIDTNFAMHFQDVMAKILTETESHVFLHPTVFKELEGLKKNKNKIVRQNAQLGFDIIENFQRTNRLQWTRRPNQNSHFKNPDEQIINGVLNEINHGTRLVFASHDKGARILARSLDIAVLEPLKMKKVN